MSDFAEISLRNLLEHAHVGIVIHDACTRIVYVNPAALRLLRLSYEQMLGRDAMDPGWNFIDEANRRLQPEEFPVNKVLRFQSPLRNEVIGVIDGNADATWMTVNAYPECTADGQIGFVVVIFADISSDRARFSFRDIVQNTDDMVIVTEADPIDAPSGPRIVYVNPAVEAETGYSAAELIGDTPRVLQGGLTDPAARARIREQMLARQPVREKLLNYTKCGTPYWVEMNIVPLYNRFGDLTHFAAIERNVSSLVFQAEQLARRNEDLRALRDKLQQLVNERTLELRNANQKLERLAYYDALTQVPNRRSFLDQAKQQLARAARRGDSVLVGILDLDHFKRINDSEGHAVGDLVLVAVAQCLSRLFRQEDVFGRMGGEEFAFCIVMAPGVDRQAVGERLRGAVAALETRTADDRPLPVSCSIGLAVVADGSESAGASRAEGESPQTIDAAARLDDGLARADLALFSAKAAGRNCVRLAD